MKISIPPIIFGKKRQTSKQVSRKKVYKSSVWYLVVGGITVCEEEKTQGDNRPSCNQVYSKTAVSKLFNCILLRYVVKLMLDFLFLCQICDTDAKNLFLNGLQIIFWYVFLKSTWSNSDTCVCNNCSLSPHTLHIIS